MAARQLLTTHELSDLCIGKPALRPISASTSSVSDSLSRLRLQDPSLSLWSCSSDTESPRCVGKISTVDVIAFLCKEDNVGDPVKALESPVSELLPKVPQTVKLLDPRSSLLEAVDCILEGAHSIIVPRRSRNFGSPKKNLSKKRQFCWITEEDIIRFFLNSINHFSSIASLSLQSLNIIEEKIPHVHYTEPAISAITAAQSAAAVAVVDDEGRLVGEISLNTLAGCDGGHTVAPAVAVLSAGDLIDYIDYGGPPEDLLQLVKERLKERKLEGMLELLEDDHDFHSNSSVSSALSSSSASSSSDDEAGFTKHARRSNSGGFVRGTEPIVCHPGSSLVAVMIQALSHRSNYAWVVEQDYKLVGIVTFAGMLKVFRDRVPSLS